MINQIIEHDGGTGFRLEYMAKKRLARLDELPLSPDAHEEAVDWDALLAEGEGGEQGRMKTEFATYRLTTTKIRIQF